MPTAFFRIFAFVKDYKWRFIVSQVAMAIAAIATVFFATLISALVRASHPHAPYLQHHSPAFSLLTKFPGEELKPTTLHTTTPAFLRPSRILGRWCSPRWSRTSTTTTVMA